MFPQCSGFVAGGDKLLALIVSYVAAWAVFLLVCTEPVSFMQRTLWQTRRFVDRSVELCTEMYRLMTTAAVMTATSAPRNLRLWAETHVSH